MLYSHNQLYIHICMQKHIQHNNNEQTQFFRKIYLSLYWKGCVREGVLDWTELQHIDPQTLQAITAFLSHSPGLLNRGPGDQASARTWFSFQHLLSNWLDFPEPSYIIVLRPLNSNRRQSRLSPDILDWMHLLFTQVHFLFWQPGRVGGQHATLPINF